jgi:hypothetical protein
VKLALEIDDMHSRLDQLCALLRRGFLDGKWWEQDEDVRAFVRQVEALVYGALP